MMERMFMLLIIGQSIGLVIIGIFALWSYGFWFTLGQETAERYIDKHWPRKWEYGDCLGFDGEVRFSNNNAEPTNE
jgi:hypothetical protein